MRHSDRCVIFFREGYVGVQPTVANVARYLEATGYEVTIYANPTDAPDPGDLGGVRIEYLRATPMVERIGAVGRGRFRLWKVGRRIVPEAHQFAWRCFVRELRARGGGAGRTVYIGVDADGALAALLCARLFARSYLFLSLELKAMAELRRGLRGAMARVAYRCSAAVTVQGRDRLAVLTRELRWEHPQVFILPNSPYSAGPTATAFDLRARLRIAPTQRIALQAGMINDVTCASELARGFAAIPGWALVLHERLKRSADDPYLRGLRKLNAGNLHLSLDPVPYDQVGGVFGAADIGLCFYKPQGPDDENFRLISSSGKLTHCLQHGKPVLVSDVPPLVELVEAYRCGIVVKHPADSAELALALSTVSERYEEMSRNASRCFAERYDFGRAMEPVTRFMDQL
jgi:glycosyltransferase involved in cell wall biosynthesis